MSATKQSVLSQEFREAVKFRIEDANREKLLYDTIGTASDPWKYDDAGYSNVGAVIAGSLKNLDVVFGHLRREAEEVRDDRGKKLSNLKQYWFITSREIELFCSALQEVDTEQSATLRGILVKLPLYQKYLGFKATKRLY